MLNVYINDKLVANKEYKGVIDFHDLSCQISISIERDNETDKPIYTLMIVKHRLDNDDYQVVFLETNTYLSNIRLGNILIPFKQELDDCGVMKYNVKLLRQTGHIPDLSFEDENVKDWIEKNNLTLLSKVYFFVENCNFGCNHDKSCNLIKEGDVRKNTHREKGEYRRSNYYHKNKSLSRTMNPEEEDYSYRKHYPNNGYYNGQNPEEDYSYKKHYLNNGYYPNNGYYNRQNPEEEDYLRRNYPNNEYYNRQNPEEENYNRQNSEEDYDRRDYTNRQNSDDYLDRTGMGSY